MILDLSTASSSLLSSIRTTLGAIGLLGNENIQDIKNFTQGQILSAGVDLYALLGGGGGGGGLDIATLNNYLSTNNISLSTTNVIGDLTIYGILSSLSSVSVNQIVITTQDLSTSTTGLFVTGDVSFSEGVILSSGSNLLDVFVPRTTLNSVTGSWQSNYTTTTNNSANWQGTYITVSALSAQWGIDSTVRSLTSKWDSNYTTTNTNSASWNSNYSTTNSNSANWILQNGNTLGSDIIIGTEDEFNIQFITQDTTRVTILNNGTIEINDNNQPSDFQIGSQGINYLFFIDGTTDKVGIHTNTPTERLTVIGNITAAGNISGGNINAAGRVTANEVLTNNLSALGDITYINTNVSVVSSVTVENYGTGPALLVQQHGNQPAARFVDKDDNTPFAIENSGKVVIGDTITSSQILTIHGGLSSRDSINVGNATSDSWNSNYTTTNTNSASWGANSTAFLTGQNFRATPGLRYLVNTLTNVVTAFLPTTPTTGTVIYFEDPFNYWGTQNFVVSANYKIGGTFQPLNCNVNDAAFYLTFISELTGWKVKVI